MRTEPDLRGTCGFTLIELLTASTIGSVVVLAGFSLFMSQARLFGAQREILEARESTRSAAALLITELREIAATDGDLYLASRDSVVFRATLAAGVVCSHDWVSGSRRVAIRNTTGTGEPTTTDSVLAYRPDSARWETAGISALWYGPTTWDPAPGGGGAPVCFWGDSSITQPRPEAALELTGDSATVSGITTGSPIRVFRRTKYALFERNARWYLGRREGAATSYELLTGPLRSPADSGLVFSYFDSTGTATTVPADVRRIEIHLRSESTGTMPSGRPSLDSLTAVTYLRNND